MNLRFIDWIWHIKGSVPLSPGQSNDEIFDRLAPLFRETGTSHELQSDTLVFRKKDQAAQDKMSVFDHGILQIEKGVTGSVLRYHMTSRALLFCFLAPLLFLAFGQLTIAVGTLEGPPKDEASKKKADAKDEPPPLHWIDKALGAPAPEKPKTKPGGQDEGGDDKPSPTPAYVFAGIFATLYVVGRVLEDRLVRSLLRKKLHG